MHLLVCSKRRLVLQARHLNLLFMELIRRQPLRAAVVGTGRMRRGLCGGRSSMSSEREIELAAQLHKRMQDLVQQRLTDMELRKWCVQQAQAREPLTPEAIFKFVTAPLAKLLRETISDG